MKANKMERGSEALNAHMRSLTKLELRQTRRGWCQEILGCEAKTEFRYYANGTEVFHSLDDANCCARLFCPSCYTFTTNVKELNTEADILSVNRPCTCPASACKCCCYQQATFSSNNSKLGRMTETCYFCVPSFKVYDSEDTQLYLIHPPVCCGGMCVNCCAEGNPCGKGCCKQSFRIYNASVGNQGGDDYEGLIMKKPKSAMVEVFTEADVFEVDYPKNATVAQKGILTGAAIFLNALFFEGDSSG